MVWAAVRCAALIVAGLLWWVTAGALLLIAICSVAAGATGILSIFPGTTLIGLILFVGLLMTSCICVCVGAAFLAEGSVPAPRALAVETDPPAVGKA
jgi:hypothetical protein